MKLEIRDYKAHRTLELAGVTSMVDTVAAAVAGNVPVEATGNDLVAHLDVEQVETLDILIAVVAKDCTDASCGTGELAGAEAERRRCMEPEEEESVLAEQNLAAR